jgi:hypothetical protein
MSVQTESERLLTFYPFDEDVLAIVEEVANNQRRGSFESLNSSLPESERFYPRGAKPIDVIDTGPKEDSDRTLIYHQPMGAGLDENQRARLATLSAALPTTRIIAAGDPGPPGQKSGRLYWRQVPGVWRGDLRATVDPVLQYVHSQNLTVITHSGASYGADKAPTAAIYSSEYEQTVEQVISIDPPSVEDRKFLDLEALGVIRLGLDFKRSGDAQAQYVEGTHSEACFEARRLADQRNGGMRGYKRGLARISNVAAANALAKADFEGRVMSALIVNPEMRADITWGTLSELAINGLISAIVQRLEDRYGSDRVSGTAMEGQKHAMCDDIFLHAATVLQSLKKNLKQA